MNTNRVILISKLCVRNCGCGLRFLGRIFFFFSSPSTEVETGKLFSCPPLHQLYKQDIAIWDSYFMMEFPITLCIGGVNLGFSFFFFFIMIFIFYIIAGLQCSVNFPLYSKVTQPQIHVYIIFYHIIMLHYKWLNIVPSAIQQDLIAYPFQMQ